MIFVNLNIFIGAQRWQSIDKAPVDAKPHHQAGIGIAGRFDDIIGKPKAIFRVGRIQVFGAEIKLKRSDPEMYITGDMGYLVADSGSILVLKAAEYR